MKIFTRFLMFLLIFCFSKTNAAYGQLAGQIPLNPAAVPQFVDPLPHFAGLRVDAKSGGNLTIKMVPHQQIAVSTGTVLATGTVNPLTSLVGLANVWVYQISKDGGATFTPPLWPAFTIEANRGNALNVTYVNALTAPNGVDPARYSDVGLIVDQTLHWADPMGQMGSFNPYTGDPPATVHLHGGEVPPLSDGGPDSWFTPLNTKTGHAFNPDPYIYPNTQEAATLWFHDHALGVTRLNVYAGLAGFYFLRGLDEEAAHLPGWSGDDKVQEAAGGFQSAPYLPEIEIAIQDRMFDNNGQLYFPNLPTNPTVHPVWTPEFEGDIITVNGKTWPYLSVAPRKYRFRILNGSNARTYELWLQDLVSGMFGPVINQIGTDGGLLDAPVVIDPNLGGKLVLMPGERADVVIDFSAMPGATWTMRNSGKTPYPAGVPPKGSTVGRIMQFVVNGTMLDGPDPDGIGGDASSLPATLRTPLVKLTNFTGAAAAGVPVAKIRQLTLNEVMGMGGPLEALVNNSKWSGLSEGTAVRTDFTAVPNVPDATDPIMDFTYYSETMDEGTTEIWKIINLTGDAHPIHLHLVQFQLMSRQNFNTNKYNKAYNAAFPGGVFIGGYGPPLNYKDNQTPLSPIPTIGGNPDVTPYLQGPLRPANANERGWKDTFIMYPGQVTTVIARWAPTDKPATTPASDLWFPFDPNGGHGYVWHCHIIDHEDNEMMRPYNVNPNTNPSVTRTFVSQATVLPTAAMKGTTFPGSSAMKGSSSLNTSDQLSENINAIVLEQNYPNPFSGETQIRFTLPEAAHIQLILLNSQGAQVQTLIDAEAPAGLNTVRLDAGNLKGGIYFYQLRTGNITQVKKMIILN